VLYYKALVEDRFKWPKGNDALLTITGQQLNWLLDGFDISAMKGHQERHYDTVF
jgi:transposase